MTRSEFVTHAVIQMMHPSPDESARARNARQARQSAEALADELGLVEPLRGVAVAVDDELRAAKGRIAELEVQLDQATAPKARTK